MAKTGLSMLDPLDMWREALSNWEGGANSMAGKELSSPEFVRMLHATSTVLMGMQQSMGKANDGLLKALNLPTRADITELGERLQRVESLLEQLVQRSGGALAGAVEPAAMPARTRKPKPAPAPEPAAPPARPSRGKRA